MAGPVFRAVGYRRVSMREQVDGHSLDAQDNHIRQYVHSQGWLTALKNRLRLNEIFRAGSKQVNSGQGERRAPRRRVLDKSRW